MSVKRRFVLYVTYTVLGAVLNALAFFELVPVSMRTYISSAGLALLVVGVVKMLRFRAILSDPEKAREFDARMSEERTVFLVRKARSVVFYCSLAVQLVGAVVFQVLGESLVSQVLCYLTAAQGIGYFVVWQYLDHKY